MALKEVAASQNSSVAFVGGKVFIPISLGNHYYSSAILRKVIDDFISKSDVSIIFLCDRLRFLSYRIRGETDIRRINSNIQIQLDQMAKTLINLGIKSCSNTTIANWSYLHEDPRYFSLLSALEILLRKNPEVGRQLKEYAMKQIYRFGGAERTISEASMHFQLQYITEETALSLYMTEIRGYNFEIYRRGMGFVDYLYDQRSDDLKLLTGNSALTRHFISIERTMERAC